MTGTQPENTTGAAAAASQRHAEAGLIDTDRGFVNTDHGVDDRDVRDVDADPDRAGEVPVGGDAALDANERPDPSEGAVVDGVASDPLLNVADGRPETLNAEPVEGAAHPTGSDRLAGDPSVVDHRDAPVVDHDATHPDAGRAGGATAADDYNQEQHPRP